MPKIGEHPTGGLPVQLDDTDKQAVTLYSQIPNGGWLPVEGDSNTSGMLKARLYADENSALSTDSIDDTIYGSPIGLTVCAPNTHYNGSQFERSRGNTEETVAASAARTAALTSSDLTNYNARGVLIFVNVTARAAATTLDLTIEAKDPVSGEYKEIFDIAAAINTADDTLIYQVYPTLPHANMDYTEEVEAVLPRTFRIVVTPNARLEYRL